MPLRKLKQLRGSCSRDSLRLKFGTKAPLHSTQISLTVPKKFQQANLSKTSFPKMETPSHIMAWGFLVANQDALHEAVTLKSPMGIIMEAIVVTLRCIISGRIRVSAIMTL